MIESIVIQKPVVASRLVLLFHGVGSNPNSLVTLGRWLADNLDRAMIVSVAAPYSFDMGLDLQWFSIKGITEENRLERIQEVMPTFFKCVRQWQVEAKVGAEDTALVGFSQGAIMALSSTQLVAEPLARQVVSLSGRFAEQPLFKPEGTSIHFLHGEKDFAIPISYAQQGYNWLKALGASTTLDSFEGLSHTISHEESVRLLELLKHGE